MLLCKKTEKDKGVVITKYCCSSSEENKMTTTFISPFRDCSLLITVGLEFKSLLHSFRNNPAVRRQKHTVVICLIYCGKHTDVTDRGFKNQPDLSLYDKHTAVRKGKGSCV